MNTGLEGKAVLVTGATRNHGRASALAFAEEGANLLLCTRQSMDLLEETAQLASKSGVRVVTGQCDVTDEAQVESFVKMGLAEFGRIDVLVNNAAWRARGELLSISSEDWAAAMAVNLHAPFLVCKAVVPGMVEQRWGRIINYSGIAPLPGRLRTGHSKNGMRRADPGHRQRVRKVQHYGQLHRTGEHCRGADPGPGRRSR